MKLTLPLACIIAPVTYAWKRGDEWLYVGSSKRGVIARLLSHKFIRPSTVQDEDILEVWPVKTIREARELEHELQRNHKPKHNIYIGIGTSFGRGRGRKSRTVTIYYTGKRCGGLWPKSFDKKLPEAKRKSPEWCRLCRRDDWDLDTPNPIVESRVNRNHR